VETEKLQVRQMICASDAIVNLNLEIEIASEHLRKYI
jgi:hypothetical protein